MSFLKMWLTWLGRCSFRFIFCVIVIYSVCLSSSYFIQQILHKCAPCTKHDLVTGTTAVNRVGVLRELIIWCMETGIRVQNKDVIWKMVVIANQGKGREWLEDLCDHMALGGLGEGASFVDFRRKSFLGRRNIKNQEASQESAWCIGARRPLWLE